MEQIGIPKQFYKYQTGVEQIHSEGTEKWGLDKLDITDNGVYVYITNAQFPYKNFIYCNPEGQQTLFSANMVKALFIETLKSFPIWVYLFIDKQKLLDSFNRIAFKIASPHILKDSQWSNFARGLHFLIFMFLLRIGFEEKSCDRFAEIFVWMIDCDNAYRLRLEDIFSASSRRQLMSDPIGEMKRLVDVYLDRDTNFHVKKVFVKLSKMIIYLLYIPKYKKAFVESLRDCDYMSLELDDADEYWVINREDYKFMGMTLVERARYALDRGWVMPKPI